MLNKNKKKYGLKKEDQLSYYFESLFLVTIQIALCAMIWASEEIKFTKVKNNYSLQLVMFFTTSCLHYSCVYTIRNAIAMCKYAVYHHDEFSDPVPAFILGVLVSISTVMCEVTNLYSTLD